MTGTEKQVAWAEDIKVQVMEAAHELYEGSLDQKQGITFEQTPAGHIAIFASEHMDNAKFWINSIGYAITDYNNRDEAVKRTCDLHAIIKRMVMYFNDDSMDSFFAEEEELRAIRRTVKRAYMAARRESK